MINYWTMKRCPRGHGYLVALAGAGSGGRGSAGGCNVCRAVKTKLRRKLDRLRGA